MINVNDKGVRIEGNLRDLMIEWTYITKDLYKEAAREKGLKETSIFFMNILKKAAGAAAIELKLEGKLPEESDENDIS